MPPGPATIQSEPPEAAIKDSSSRFARWGTGWRAHVLLLLVFTIVAAPLIGVKAVDSRELSVWDEWQYADRVHEVTEGDLVMRDGVMISPWAHNQLSCRGIVRIVGPDLKKCGKRHGEAPNPNSAAPDPPSYFWVTGALTAVSMKLGLTDNLITTGRLVGIVWAALSMWSLFVLAREFGASRAPSLVAASTVVLVPALSQQYTYMTPHALDIPVGALATLATLRWLHGRWSWWPLALAGVAVAMSKGSNVAITVAVGIALLTVLAWPSSQFDRSVRKKALIGGIVLGGSTLVALALWQWYVGVIRLRTYEPPGDFIVDSLDMRIVLNDVSRFVTPFGENGMAVFGSLFIVAMLGSALVHWAGLVPSPPVLRPVAAGYLVGSLAAAAVLGLMVYLTSDQWIPMQIRYGLALWPLGLAFAALLLRTRTAIGIAACFLVAYWATPMLLGLDGITT